MSLATATATAAAATIATFLPRRDGSLGSVGQPAGPENDTQHVVPAATEVPTAGVCTGRGVTTDYNVGMHVLALFVVLIVSTLACAFPIIAKRYPKLRIPLSLLFFVRHFGTGVLVATAFVHLLPTAWIALSNPCLGSFWTEQYPAMPGAIAMGSMFFVVVIEMTFMRMTGGGVCGGHHVNQPAQPEVVPFDGGESGATSNKSNQDVSVNSRSTEQIIEEEEAVPVVNEKSEPQPEPDDDSEQESNKRALMQCFILEMGILAHSVFIGLSLAVTIGPELITLLVAICFHQCFEGLALGARIQAIDFKKRLWQPWLMALAYGLTTPFGMAIGIGTHSLYSPDSEVGLLTQGIANAVSSGFLLFAGLVELLAEDFLTQNSYESLKGRRRVWGFIYVVLGAVGMSVVGAWA